MLLMEMKLYLKCILQIFDVCNAMAIRDNTTLNIIQSKHISQFHFSIPLYPTHKHIRGLVNF